MIEDRIQNILKDQFNINDIRVDLSRPDPKFGDFATNIALKLSGKVGQNPRDIADTIAKELSKSEDFADVSVDGPGFINIRMKDDSLLKLITKNAPQLYKNQTIVVEYSDPNAFKVLHAGHFYTSVVGDAIANLVENAGGNVKRLNFGGDVGLHAGKTMWCILQKLGGENPEKLNDINVDSRADWLASCYVEGTSAFEDDQQAHQEIVECNKRIYQLHKDKDHDSNFAKIYWQTREWSYDYFKKFYSRIGSHFDKFYPESAVAERGYKEVKSHIGDVFEESEGAVVFKGEKYGLHTRVFINKQDLPTYESKDVGLIFQKYDDWHFDKSIIVTADEQKQYMQVVLKALEQFAPKLALSTIHLTHGLVKLAGGTKMSSRKGNFLKAVDIIDYALLENKQQNNSSMEEVALGAIKYAFLKQRIGGDIIYDPKESVSLVGNSGTYLQYSYARASSILKKVDGGLLNEEIQVADLDENERLFALKMTEYNEVVGVASKDFSPHIICTYLYELAQNFNRFYEKSRIIGHQKQALRLYLLKNYTEILEDGLILLGISAPEKM